jgi:exosome complex component RRP45
VLTARPSPLGIELMRILDQVMKDSRVVETESLCIVAYEKVRLSARAHNQVWSIRVDVHVLDHDGGLIDAIVLAALAGLLHFKLCLL